MIPYVPYIFVGMVCAFRVANKAVKFKFAFLILGNNPVYFFFELNNHFENENDFIPIKDDLNCRYNDNNEIYFEVEEIEVFQMFED